MKIVHIISGLSTGGAEIMLFKFLSSCDSGHFNHTVVSLTDRGTIGDNLERIGIPVHTIDMRKGHFLSFFRVWPLIRMLRQLRPDIIQGWMYHGNIAASAVSMLILRHTKVVWNIRHTVYDLKNEKKLTSLLIRLGSKPFLKANKVIYNSRVSLEQHEKYGYNTKNSVVLPNGFNCDLFKPNNAFSNRFRLAIGLGHTDFLIGIIARYHPMKDHATFLKAVEILKKKYPNVHFIMVGKGLDENNKKIITQIQRAGLNACTHLLGERDNIPEIVAALDIVSLTSSWGEGFPNVIGEAMASCVPCVVTDVGDSAFIVGDTGIVVPPRDPVSLCKGWVSLIEMGEEKRKELGAAARKRIMDYFSLPAITQQYEDLYRQVLNSD